MKRSLQILVLLGSLFVWTVPRTSDASTSAERLAGLVLSVLPARHQIVVRGDDVGSKAGVTTLYRLAPDVRIASLHAGDRIDARVEQRPDGVLLDDVEVVPASAPKSPVRIVTALQIGDEMPATRFVDQLGHSFAFSDFLGKSVVLAFIYTRCQDAKECPLISANFAKLQTRLAGGPYHLVEMTFDPTYDKPSVLAKYGALFGADPTRWTFGTGDPNTVLDFAAKFSVEPFEDPRIGLIHTERTVLIGPNGKIVDFIDQAGWSAGDLVARLQAVDAPFSNPIARLDFELSKVAVAVCGNRVAGFSGIGDLTIVLVIVATGAFLLMRVARKIFVEQV